MIVSHTHRFVYFAMPKTGSSTVRALLQPYNEVTVVEFDDTTPDQPFFAHMRPAELAAVWSDEHPPFESYLRFTVVRNPWARLVSLHNHLMGTRRFPWERRLGLVGRTFDQWVERIEASGKGAGMHGARYRRYGSYSVPAFCGDDDGNLMVDEFITLDRLADDLPPLAERLGVDIADPGWDNRRQHRPYREYYSDRSRQLVAERYAWEIERFGFEF